MEEQKWLGLTFAFLAAFFTGSYQVPRKLPSLQKLQPALTEQIYVFYVGIGFGLSCWLSCLLLPYNKILMGSPLVGSTFVFTWWGALSGALVLAALSIGFFAISRLGIALNAACSMGAAALTSFLWGVLINNDKVSLVWVDVLAVFLIVAGGALAALFKEAGDTAVTIKRFVTHEGVCLERRNTFDILSTRVSESELGEGVTEEGGLRGAPPTDGQGPPGVSAPLLRRVATSPPGSQVYEGGSCSPSLEGGVGSSSFGGSPGVRDEETPGSVEGLTAAERALGTLASITSGIVGGASLGPMSFVQPNAKGLAFLPSFGIGIGVANVVALCLHMFYRWMRGRQLSPLHLKKALLPGLLSGVLYFCSAICVILAIPRISFSVAYPTKQSAVIFSGLWGVCFYSELKGKSIFVFALGSCCILAGAALLSTYTYPTRLGIPEAHHMSP